MKTNTLRAALVAAALISLPAALYAQTEAQAQAPATATAAPAVAAPAPAPAQTQEITLGYLWDKGGWCMWPLALCSLIGVGLAIYNGIIIKPSRLMRPDVVDLVYTSVRQLDFKAAQQACTATPCMIGNIIAAGLHRIKGDRLNIESVEKGMEESAVEEFASYIQPINGLSIVATIAPMLGLLGTVSGMITGFHTMALGGMGRPELLADSISEALITTLVGLVIGIPAMVAYFFFKNKYSSIAASVSRVCGDLLEHIKSVCRQYADGIPVVDPRDDSDSRRHVHM
jgi:biopolymer transport protein ExbB